MFTWFTGSSAATPIISAICYRLLLINPQLTSVQIKRLLLTTATKEQTSRGIIQVVNYARAARAAHERRDQT